VPYIPHDGDTRRRRIMPVIGWPSVRGGGGAQQRVVAAPCCQFDSGDLGSLRITRLIDGFPDPFVTDYQINWLNGFGSAILGNVFYGDDDASASLACTDGTWTITISNELGENGPYFGQTQVTAVGDCVNGISSQNGAVAWSVGAPPGATSVSFVASHA
jgi:hypothetical protein